MSLCLLSPFSQALSENRKSFLPWLFQCKKEKVGEGRKGGKKKERRKEGTRKYRREGQSESYNKKVT